MRAPRFRGWLPWFVGGVALTFLLVAVPSSPVTRFLARALAGNGFKVRLAHSRPSPATPAAGEARPELRAAVSAMVSPRRTYLQYRQLYLLLAQRTGRRLRFVQRKTYAEINDLLVEGKVDLAWVCTGALRDLAERHGAALLAAPVIGGRSRYRAYVIVGDDTRLETLDDLRGTRFAFTDPLSLTGRRVIVEWLARHGERPGSFFSEVVYTHAHDNSILAVQRHFVDAATVDALVYDWLKIYDPNEVRGTRIIWRSRWFPAPPLVVSSHTPPALRARLAEVVLGLDRDPEAQPVLRRLGVQRFVKPDPALYWPR